METVPEAPIFCVSPGPDLKQEIPETSEIKEEPEEQSIKQEEELISKDQGLELGEMSVSQTLRALVNARLTAAAEDIVALFDGKIAEFEEELCRCKQENQRKQELLDEALKARSPIVVTHTDRGVQMSCVSPGPALKQVKEESEEQSIKQEEEQLTLCVPGCSGVCVKTKQHHTEPKKKSKLKERTSAQSHISTQTLSETLSTLLTLTMMKTGELHSAVQTKSRPEAQAQHHKTLLCPPKTTQRETLETMDTCLQLLKPLKRRI
ncbi:hypothetical protein WMY93_028232 [Mugilogobius chulae]|uniref:Uncharacterized protein n=1 Tax=Mugilogobius chulae TaxID=88201 RepID=A0AAW0MUJ0_9GOBI